MGQCNAIIIRKDSEVKGKYNYFTLSAADFLVTIQNWKHTVMTWN